MQSVPHVQASHLWTQPHPPTSSLYVSLKREPPRSGSSSSVGYKQCSKARTLHRALQAKQLPRPYLRASC
eukprot:9381768-Ditylum_brightwellii.AAC.1